eukprot:CAMPEP_0177770170 /NCGR_PEP_ID=MMETSP0491_2-20121128/10765_1 /TAXON_ID=63592 /ORGANISM="Tetraselmis chuii, Strain PLY429" /LENGTH=532 /DNA_ID=CAMNT_0019287333 /DNA_START=144 /DNA_END=1742 /DNA_ORIENTATION=+
MTQGGQTLSDEAMASGGPDGETLFAVTRAERLASLEQKAFSVSQLAKRFEMGLLFEEEEGDKQDTIQGKELFQKLTETAKNLRGRVAGRNADDVDEISEGLAKLVVEWDAREHKIEKTLTEANRAMWEFRQLASLLRKEEEKDRDDAHTGGRDRVRTKELEQKANEAASKAAALARAQEELAAENASLQEELTKLQAEEEAKEARIGQLEAEASELRKMATSAANVEEVATVQAKQEEEAVRMAEELKVEQRKGKELERDLAALQRKYDGLQRELAGVQEEAASRQEAIARAEAERAAEIALVPNPALGPNEYQILGRPMLGGTLRVADANGDPPSGGLQWSRTFTDGSSRPIAGACRTQYSPDPMDVGCVLCCTIGKGDGKVSAVTKVAVQLAPGLKESVHKYLSSAVATFNIVIVQLNGEVQSRRGMFHLRVHPAGVEIMSSSGKVKFKAEYTQSMQVCGARGGGDAASHGVYLCLQPNLALMLACENAHDRNVCIMLIRQFALKHNIILGGPKDDLKLAPPPTSPSASS